MKRSVDGTFVPLAAAVLAATLTVSVGARRQDPKPAQAAPKAAVVGLDGKASALPPMGSGTGVIFGRVTDAGSNRPVAGAVLTLGIPGTEPIRIMTDGEGRFGFRDLPPGRFVLTASKPGWTDGAYGRTRPAGPGVPLVLKDDERVSDIALPMWRYAAITGMVTNELGEPVVGVPVRVLKRELVGGRIQLTPGAQDQTDDRGIYRIGLLDPGESLVAVPRQQNMSESEVKAIYVAEKGFAAGGGKGTTSVAPTFSGDVVGLDEDGRQLIFPTTFYPNAVAAANAMVVTVDSSEEIPAIDFRLQAVPTSRVSGRLAGPDGPGANLKVNLAPADADEMGSTIEWFTAISNATGDFTITDVPPGRYVLRSVGGAAGGGKTPVAKAVPSVLWAQMALVVETEDLGGVTVDLRPGIRLSGLVQFTGGAAQPAPAKVASIRLVLEPADSRPGLIGDKGQVDATGRFSTGGVAAGRYFLRVAGAPPGWTLHSAIVNGRDANDVAVDLGSADVGNVAITFTDRPGELSGHVSLPTGSPEPVAVLVFPTDAAAWTGYGSSSRRMVSTRADAGGAFRVQGLPAGEYFAVAIPDRLAADWQNPAFLASLTAGAERARVRDGERLAVSLKMAR